MTSVSERKGTVDPLSSFHQAITVYLTSSRYFCSSFIKIGMLVGVGGSGLFPVGN